MNIKSTILGMSFLFLSCSAFAENWKGRTEVSPVELGVLTGMGMYGNYANWSILGTGAYLLKPEGWVDDVNERVWIELQMGPSFFSQDNVKTGLQYSTHLRWDFTFNEFWTFYGLGGLGGFVLPSYLGSTFIIHPRFGVGAEYQTKTALMFRGEVSAELIAVGIALNF